MGNQKARQDCVFICAACGKMAEWKYGFAPLGRLCVRSPGYDESCGIHASEVNFADLPPEYQDEWNRLVKEQRFTYQTVVTAGGQTITVRKERE